MVIPGLKIPGWLQKIVYTLFSVYPHPTWQPITDKSVGFESLYLEEIKLAGVDLSKGNATEFDEVIIVKIKPKIKLSTFNYC